MGAAAAIEGARKVGGYTSIEFTMVVRLCTHGVYRLIGMPYVAPNYAYIEWPYIRRWRAKDRLPVIAIDK